ncbi:hypothetical protein JCM9279_004822 [Rhodotorula babjevae]
MAGPPHHGPRSSRDRLVLPLVVALVLVCTASILLLDHRPRGRPLAQAQQQQQRAGRPRRPLRLNLVDSSAGRLRFVTGTQRTSSIGSAVQRACGELEPGYGEWISMLEQQDETCSPQDKGVDMAELVRSSLQQCGSWCVWDLTTPERRGWHVSDGCFVPFSTPHYCDRWWFQRPGRRELEEAREAAGEDDEGDGAGALGEDLGIDART